MLISIVSHRLNLLVTARVRSTRESNTYTWECLSVYHGGEGGYLILPNRGSTPSFPMGGVPQPSQWGVPHLTDREGWTPGQDWMGVPPIGTGWQLNMLCRRWYASCGFPQEGFSCICVHEGSSVKSIQYIF